MPRFNSEVVTVVDADGVSREYTVIADRASFETVNATFGAVKVGSGFIRCNGKQYLGQYGQHTPVMVGDENETYYAPMSFFDGRWSHTGADNRGLYQHVTARSDGELFAALEAFSAEAAVPICG
jgi:hypothetical protein